MKPLIETKPETLDDLIFEDRNKIYGAYLLRSSYESTLRKSIAIATVLFVASLILANMAFRKTSQLRPPIAQADTVFSYSENSFRIKPETSANNNAKKEVDEHNYVAVEKPIKKLDKEEPSPGSGTTGSLIGSAIGAPGEGGNANHSEVPGKTGNIVSGNEGNTHEDKAYLIPDQMPEFPGGADALSRYIVHNFSVPNYIEEQLSIKVYFIVDEEGKIGSVSTSDSHDPSIISEAERVVKNMPAWKPGKVNGRPVKVQYRLPIRIMANY
jgi:protein TonB